MLNTKGYSLVELIIVMGIFVTVMMMTSTAFERIIGKSGAQAKSAESNIEGIVGLEVLRSDIEHAGYGLPWSFQNWSSSVKYQEVDVASDYPANGIDSNSFNDLQTRNIRAVMSDTSTTTGMDYLVIKATNVAMNQTARKWSYVNYSAAGVDNRSYIRQWESSSQNLTNGDRIITIGSTFSAGGLPGKRLMMNGDSFYYPMSGPEPPAAAFKPGDQTQLFIAYGINQSSNLRMPFNRADFFVRTPTKMPAECAPGTGIFYKAVVNHTSGGFDFYPLLDCVGDMKVEFELDYDRNGNVAYSPTLTDAGGTPLSAQEIRDQLKNVRVYVLAHAGNKDRSYTYPVADTEKAVLVGDSTRPVSSGRIWTSAQMEGKFGPDWRKYHWKVYNIVVRPKNLN